MPNNFLPTHNFLGASIEVVGSNPISRQKFGNLALGKLDQKTQTSKLKVDPPGNEKRK